MAHPPRVKAQAMVMLGLCVPVDANTSTLLVGMSGAAVRAPDGPCLAWLSFFACRFAAVQLRAGGQHLTWRVSNPPPGNWQWVITRIIVTPGATDVDPQQQVEQLPPYLVQAAVKSDVILDVAFPVPVEDRVSGVPMPIVATLTEFGPVTGAIVAATVLDPLGGSTFLVLFDDGAHGDGEAADGIYATTYYKTGLAGTSSGAGSYTVDVIAIGNTANAGNFVRQKILGFFIYSSGDDDQDLLPNEYEEMHGGSKTDLDPNGDPDGDGRSTIDEFNDGTDPLDPDSDDGGESDGSESNKGTNPHDPADDDVPPTWTVAYPGNSKVFVRYAPRPEYLLVEIHRSDSFSGTYTFLDQGMDTSGMYTGTRR